MICAEQLLGLQMGGNPDVPFLSTPVLDFNLSRNQRHIGKVIRQQMTAAKSSHLLPKVLGLAGWECAVNAWQLRNQSQAEKNPVNTIPLSKR